MKAEPVMIGGIGSGIYPRVTEYKVSVFPPEMTDGDDVLAAEEAETWSLTVAWRGRGKWAVTRFRHCLGADGEWGFEPSPSNREDDWLATHRFDLETALRFAAEHAPKVTVNGLTALDILAKHRARAGQDGPGQEGRQ
jgi:hypothetical protein